MAHSTWALFTIHNHHVHHKGRTNHCKWYCPCLEVYIDDTRHAVMYMYMCIKYFSATLSKRVFKWGMSQLGKLKSGVEAQAWHLYMFMFLAVLFFLFLLFSHHELFIPGFVLNTVLKFAYVSFPLCMCTAQSTVHMCIPTPSLLLWSCWLGTRNVHVARSITILFLSSHPFHYYICSNHVPNSSEYSQT